MIKEPDTRAARGAYGAVLDALVRELLEAQTDTIEAASKARRSMADIKEEEAGLERNLLSDARDHVDAFHEALSEAHRLTGGSGPVVYDQNDPVQNAHADLLIQYLVRPGYAEVQSLGEPGHYRYEIDVQWDRLQSLAESLGHHLPL
jgi:hypothetical protein